MTLCGDCGNTVTEIGGIKYKLTRNGYKQYKICKNCARGYPSYSEKITKWQTNFPTQFQQKETKLNERLKKILQPTQENTTKNKFKNFVEKYFTE